MQSKNVHVERLTLAALDKVIELVREAARSEARSRSRQFAEQLTAVNELLLRPTRQAISELATVGLSHVEQSPAAATKFPEPVPDEPLSVPCSCCGAAVGMKCVNLKKQPKGSACRERKYDVGKYALPNHPAWAGQPADESAKEDNCDAA